MSLLKRLWLSIAVLLMTVFAVTMTVFGLSGSSTLQKQLAIETENTARSLAQVLSLEAQLSEVDTLDPVIVQLRLSPFTDLSEFEIVELRDPTGAVIFRSQNTPAPTEAPDWFKQFFAVETFAATAPVMLGWNNWDLSLTPFGGAAYDELWRVSKRSAVAMIAAFFVAGLIGQLLLSRLLLPLNDVVYQASAIGQRRFTKIEVPNTAEFAAVARSMNDLSERVQTMLADEAKLLQSKKASIDLDETTGLLNREAFVDQFAIKLQRENEEATGAAALIRIMGLADMNREYGRQAIDKLLSDIGSALSAVKNQEINGAYSSIGRMNGSDLCAIATNEINPKNLADALQRITKAALNNHGIDEKYCVAAACIEYAYGDSVGDLLTAMDVALAQSELQSGQAIVPAESIGASDHHRSDHLFWQQPLERALLGDGLALNWYPIKDKQQRILHLEGMARLTIESQEFNAGQFMPWVFRLGLGTDFDKAVVKRALAELPSHDARLHVNLSAESVMRDNFVDWLSSLLSKASQDISRLGFELSESAVLAATDKFGKMVTVATNLGCQVGIEHMGYRPEIIAELARLGPSYLKIDSLYTQNLRSNEGNKAVVTSISVVAKSLGIDCIVEGISEAEDREAAYQMGVRGASGKAIN